MGSLIAFFSMENMEGKVQYSCCRHMRKGALLSETRHRQLLLRHNWSGTRVIAVKLQWVYAHVLRTDRCTRLDTIL